MLDDEESVPEGSVCASPFSPTFLTYCVFSHEACLPGDTFTDNSPRSSSMVTHFLLFSSVVSSVSSPLRGVPTVSFISFWPLSSADTLLFLKTSTQILLLFMSSILLFSTRCQHLCHFSLWIDVNECLSGRVCKLNQLCVNTVGSYVCQRLIICPPGYQISNDICEGTAHFIGIEVASARSECAARMSIVNMRAHNGRKAHCLVTQIGLRHSLGSQILDLLLQQGFWGHQN